MATGDSDDILARVRSELPARWFNRDAPLRDAILGGISDVAAWAYSFLYFDYAQMRLATATGMFLDLFANDFLGLYLKRDGANDDVFRARIRATILQERVTRAGMISCVTQLVGSPPTIFEPWNPGDAGGWNTGAFAWAGATPGTRPGGGWNVSSGWDKNASGYDISPASARSSGGAGGWGTLLMPAQVLITVPPSVIQGVPKVGGWNLGGAAWNTGVGEWLDEDSIEVGSLTEGDIYATIAATKPTGVVAWTNIL
jgi:hypothetical protein